MAEWLGRALQKLLHQFESGRDLLYNMTYKNVKLLVLDVDGTLTDGKVQYNSDGTKSRIFSIHDGYGLVKIMKKGIDVIVITQSKCNSIELRMNDLGIKLFQGIEDKLDVLKKYISMNQIKLSEVCYVGDDLNDYKILQSVGFPIAVNNSVSIIKEIASYVTKKKGGYGAVREVVDMLLNK